MKNLFKIFAIALYAFTSPAFAVEEEVQKEDYSFLAETPAATSAMTEILQQPQYSAELAQVKALTSQYKTQIAEYEKYSKQYDDLSANWQAGGKQKGSQTTFQRQAEAISAKATESYQQAQDTAEKINVITSKLEKNVAPNFTPQTNQAKLNSASASVNVTMSQLGNVQKQFGALSSQASGNIALKTQIQGMQNYTGTIMTQLKDVQGGLSGNISGNIESLGVLNAQMGQINGMMGNLKNQVSNLMNDASGAISSTMSSALAPINSAIGGISGNLNNATRQIGGAIGGQTGNMGGMLSGSLGNLTGMKGGFDIKGKLQMPNFKNFNISGNFNLSSLGSLFSQQQKEQEDIGATPAAGPEDYCSKSDKACRNLVPTCDSPGNGKLRITKYGVCPSRAYQAGYMGRKNGEQSFAVVKKKENTSSTMDGKNVEYEYKSHDGKGEAPEFGGNYTQTNTMTKQYTENWTEASGDEILVKKVGADGKEVYDISGKQTAYISVKYKSNEEALKAGACQMISIKGGGKYDLGNGLQGVPERITNKRHPFAPRDSKEWQQRSLGSGGNSTNTCGKESLLENKKAWENGGMTVVGPKGSYTSQKGADGNFEYYKLPVANGGKILSVPDRISKYNKTYQTELAACDAATGNYKDCVKLAKRAGCRFAVLPSVKPDNFLKTGYNSQKPEDEGMPYIYSNPGGGYEGKGYQDLGTSWMNVKPSENFGYNMPPLIDSTTGVPASMGVYNKNKDRSKWEYWRTTITRVNPNLTPDSSNPEDPGVQNNGHMFGGWDQLVEYQAKCRRILGLNCICNPKEFDKGTAAGYAMSRLDEHYTLRNGNKTTYKDVTLDKAKSEYEQKLFKLSVDSSDTMTWPRTLPIKNGKFMSNAMIGQKVAGKPDEPESEWENFPGKGKFKKRGLDNAIVGDMIIWDNLDPEIKKVSQKRPNHMMFVERVEKNSDNHCILYSEANGGVGFRDAANITEDWGRVTSATICKKDDKNYPFSEGGKKGLKDCSNSQMAKCWEKEWDKWIVYRASEDTERAFDPKTGAVKSAEPCKEWKKELDTNENKIKGMQTGGWDGKDKEKELDKLVEEQKKTLKKLIDYGCQPGTKHVITDRSFSAGGVTSSQYTPTAPGESTAVQDPLYGIGGDFKFPKIDITAIIDSKKDGNKKPDSPVDEKAKACGVVAIATIKQLQKDANAGKLVYKDDCAGAVASPNKSGTVCTGKEYGRFGLVYGAYNSKEQSENVNGLWYTAPAHASVDDKEIVAFRNIYDNKVKEPNGCRINNLKPCAKAGDIVLVQYGQGITRLAAYNRWLIYDGANSFYEVQDNGQLIRFGSMPQEYSNSSYEVRHLSCND